MHNACSSCSLTEELRNAIEELDAAHKLRAESQVVGVKEEHRTGGRRSRLHQQRVNLEQSL